MCHFTSSIVRKTNLQQFSVHSYVLTDTYVNASSKSTQLLLMNLLLDTIVWSSLDIALLLWTLVCILLRLCELTLGHQNELSFLVAS